MKSSSIFMALDLQLRGLAAGELIGYAGFRAPPPALVDFVLRSDQGPAGCLCSPYTPGFQ